MRGPLTESVIANGATQDRANHVCWEYDDSIPEIRGYLNGALVTNTAQAAPIVLTSTTAAAPFFTIGGYNVSTLSAHVLG